MIDRRDLTALIGSRICHDLISPIGAIGNGVELLMMAGGPAGPEIALIAQSVAHANARIRFFRVAFGAASAVQRIGRDEVQDILTDITRGGRVQIGWTSGPDADRAAVKLAFLLLMCVETALPYGGRVRVVADDDSWLIATEGARLQIDPDLWEVLSNPLSQVPIGAAQVHFALVPAELAAQSRKLSVKISDQMIRLEF
jgi:histidine phosphotransferase ChpT